VKLFINFGSHCLVELAEPLEIAITKVVTDACLREVK
jgi:hypothetical protein